MRIAMSEAVMRIHPETMGRIDASMAAEISDEIVRVIPEVMSARASIPAGQPRMSAILRDAVKIRDVVAARVRRSA